MLKINNVTKQFGSFVALNEFSVEITESGLYLFVGDNGSGKTTLFNMIAGLIHPDKGEIWLNHFSDADARRRKLGISTEPFITEPLLTIEELADIVQNVKHISSEEIRQLLQRWEIWEARKKTFKALSTGMKKRLSLALSMAGNPHMLLWDEPFNGLDPLGIQLLNQLIQELTEQGKTIFLSTHLLNEIKIQAKAAFILKEGKLVGSVRNQSTDKYYETIINLLKNE